MRELEKRTVEYYTFNYHSLYFSMVFINSLTMGHREWEANMKMDNDLVGKLAYGCHYLASPSFRLMKMFTFTYTLGNKLLWDIFIIFI